MNTKINDYKPTYKILEDEISLVPLTQFLYALGETPVGINGEKLLYFAPYRNDTEPVLMIKDKSGIWYDHKTKEIGNIWDLAELTAKAYGHSDIADYIVMTINNAVKQMSDSKLVNTNMDDVLRIPLVDFLRAIGHKQPIASDKEFILYVVKTELNQKLTLLINPETNHWRDLSSGQHGDIYTLARVLTGNENMGELEKYIKGKMSGLTVADEQLQAKNNRNEKHIPKHKKHL